jgi:predicted Zn-dependent protease
MRYLAFLSLVLIAVCCSHAAENGPQGDSGRRPTVCIATPRAFDKAAFALLERAVAEGYGLTAEPRSFEREIGTNVEETVEVLESMLRPDDVGIVLIAGKGDGLVFREAVSVKKKVAVLNSSALVGGGKPGTELHEQRIRKECMRLVGRLAGLSPCIFPRCCMYDARRYQELDAKGGTPCPPCHDKAAELRRKRGAGR